ncbi:MAG: NTP transferase domain-containing protein [Clostridia bacterium]|nr:NTP transferase domain-containing protein [Clostridia bacterium]
MKTSLVVLAAGLGSRFGGDKQISKVGPSGELLMEYSIYDAINAGFERIIFILKEEMIDVVKAQCGDKIAKKAEVCYAVQDYSSIPDFYTVPAERVKPFGTIHATLCAKPYIDGPFATVNADDYYGAEGFKLMYDAITQLKDNKTAVIVPYILGNTLSENGGVSRGVCTVEDGKLKGIVETANIRLENGEVQSEFGKLAIDSWVSMNLWGFHGDDINEMDKFFNDFLRALPEGELKAECYLPKFVNTKMENGCDIVSFISGDKWFGMTYAADRPDVIARLKALHDSGAYPEKLF